MQHKVKYTQIYYCEKVLVYLQFPPRSVTNAAICNTFLIAMLCVLLCKFCRIVVVGVVVAVVIVVIIIVVVVVVITRFGAGRLLYTQYHCCFSLSAQTYQGPIARLHFQFADGDWNQMGGDIFIPRPGKVAPD